MDSLEQGFKCEAVKHALEETPKEACGVVVKGVYYRCRNIAENPTYDFVLDPRDYLKARLKGKIETVVHSHPEGGRASNLDMMACKQMKLPWHIYLVPKDEWLIIQP